MKLSKAQEKTLNRAKEQIDEVRKMTLEEFVSSRGVRVCDLFPLEWFEKTYNEIKNGIVTVNSTLPTLKKLEELGFIEIVGTDEYRNSNCRVFDSIKVLNY